MRAQERLLRKPIRRMIRGRKRTPHAVKTTMGRQARIEATQARLAR